MKKYGLVWEDYPEEAVENFDVNKPYLCEVEEREIKQSDDELTHLLIEGDNYEALRLLQDDLKGKVSVIYIDPPYNTKNKFVYNDNYENHSKWLSFMNKRLVLARELLTNDGVIFISIDDSEFAQLKLLCDEIFGENNFIANVIRRENAKKQKIGKPNIKTEFEYLLVYSKSFTNHFKYFPKSEYIKYSKLCIDLYSSLKKTHKNPKKVFNQLLKGDLSEVYLSTSDLKKLKQIFMLQGESKGLSMYKYIDENGVYRNSDLNMYFGKGFDYNIINPFDENSFLKRPKHLLPSKDKFLKTGLFAENENGDLFFTDVNQISEIEPQKFDYGCLIFKENTIIEYKNYLDVLSNPESILSNFMGSDEKLLQSMNLNFSYPKRVDFIKYLLSIFHKDNAIVLDFFAGSGTTGHAVLELNKEDGGNRQFILCTNNENNICEEVTYQRLNKVINGYTTSKGKDIEGVPANLKYYKVKHKN